MLRAIFGLSRPVQAEFLDAVYRQTEGNPFFVEELLKSLIAAGDIVYADGSWDRKPLEALRIPRSVKVAVQRRLDQLSQAAHELITLAAVAGRRFDFELLQALTGHDEATLIRLVKELIRAQLVIEEQADTFAFRHALTGEAVAADLLARERRALHRAVAQALERIAADRIDTRLAELSHHYEQARDWDNVLVYAARAGRQAQRLYAPQAAVDQFSRALHAAQQRAGEPRRAVMAELYQARAQAYELLSAFEAARADGEQALAMAREAGDQRLEWQSLLALGFLWTARDSARAGEYFRQALATARRLGDPAILAHSLNRMGNWYVNADQPQQGRRYHEEALSLFQQLEDCHGHAKTLDLLAGATYLAGDLPGGMALYEEAAARFRELDDRVGLASSLTWLSIHGAAYLNMMVVAAPLSEGVRTGEEALHLARAINWRSGEAFARLVLGHCLGAQGDYGRALSSAHDGLAIAQELGHTQWLAAAYLLLGVLHLDLLAPDTAAEQLEQALALARQSNTIFSVRLQSALLALAYVRLGELGRAEALLTEAFGPPPPADTRFAPTMVQRLGWYARAELALKRDQLAEALSIADRLIASADPTPDRGEAGGKDVVPVLLALCGTILGALRQAGQPADEAEAALHHAYQVAGAYGARPLLWRIQVRLGRLYQAQSRRFDAIRAFAQASQVVEELAGSLPDMPLRKAFLQRAHALIPRAAPPSPRRAARHAFDGLTEREREVAALVAQGKSNREIAGLLVTTERTAKAHVGHILGKLGFTSRTQIVAWAIDKGLGNRPTEE